MAVNSDKVLCGSFGMYPSYVAGILNSVEEIHFYLLCNKKLNYADYVEKCIAGKVCTFKFPTNYDFKIVTEHRFQLKFGGKTVTISIEARQLPKLPSELIFAQCVTENAVVLSGLRYCVHQKTCDIHN